MWGYFLHIGPNHVKLSKVFWETKSVLVLNKKLKVNWKFQSFIYCQNTWHDLTHSTYNYFYFSRCYYYISFSGIWRCWSNDCLEWNTFCRHIFPFEWVFDELFIIKGNGETKKCHNNTIHSFTVLASVYQVTNYYIMQG